MTVTELVVVATISGAVAGHLIHGAAAGADRVRVTIAQGAVLEAYRTARAAATTLGRPAEVIVADDSIVVRSLGIGDTVLISRRPGPASDGISISPMSHGTTFGANGLATGAGNVTIRLTRGAVTRQVTVSRLGRIRTT